MKNIPKLRFPEFVNAGEWEEKIFSSYIKLYRGSSPRPIQEYLTQDVFGVNWIKIGDTKNAINFTIDKVEEKITSKGAEKSRKVEIGELILANSMSFGKTYELKIEGCIYDGWFVLREYEEYFYKPFLLQLLNSEYMQQQYKNLSAGGIVQNISGDIVNKTMIFHTSKKEQQKIADCLSSVDSLISAQSQKVELLKEHKKGLMQQLFPQDTEEVPKLRFPEFKNATKWEEKRLDSIADVVPSGDLDPECFSLIPTDKHIYPVYSNSVTEEGLYGYYTYSKYEKNSVTITARGTLGVAFTRHQEFMGIGRLLVVSNLQNTLPYFLKESWNYLAKIPLENGGIPQLTAVKAKAVLLAIPKPKEQQKIADCLSSIDEQISSQTRKLKTLKEHKKALMQQLFPNANSKDK
ncbi:MAG: restriction endonuclease subunit S [Sulfurimonas sp.]|jgi:type I restriction enzyme S subunit